MSLSIALNKSAWLSFPSMTDYERYEPRLRRRIPVHDLTPFLALNFSSKNMDIGTEYTKWLLLLISLEASMFNSSLCLWIHLCDLVRLSFCLSLGIFWDWSTLYVGRFGNLEGKQADEITRAYLRITDLSTCKSHLSHSNPEWSWVGKWYGQHAMGTLDIRHTIHTQ